MVERILFKDLKYLSAKYDFALRHFQPWSSFAKRMREASDFNSGSCSPPPLINRILALIWPLYLQRGTEVHLFDKNKYAFALGKFLHAIQSLHHPPLYDLPH